MARMSDIRKKAIGAPPRDGDTASAPPAATAADGSEAASGPTGDAEVKSASSGEPPATPSSSIPASASAADGPAVNSGGADAAPPGAAVPRETNAEAADDAPAALPVSKTGEIHQWVLFLCGGIHYALKSNQIRMIEMLGEITPVPNTPTAVAGVFNLRGEIVPVVDLRARLGLPAESYSLAARIIIVQAGKRRVGMIVDSAREILHIPDELILPPPELMHGLSGKYLLGIVVQPERTILILDLASILRIEDSVAAVAASLSSQHDAK
ncbi:MAG: chemotaxis protein CheW [Bacteroidota bacterium]